MAKSTAVRFESGLTVRVQLFVVVIVVLLIAVALALIFLPPSSVHDAQRIRSGTTKSIPKSEVQSSASKGSSSSDRYIRLPSSNFPTLYTLKLQLFLPYREVFDFGIRNYTTEGDLRIDFKCIESNDRIVLNAKHINIDASSILIVNDVNRSISFAAINTYRYEPDDIYAIEFRLDSFLIAGNSYSVYLKYHGRIGDVWAGGLYKADYDIDGETRTLAATQLQPTDASRVLPCFDEPEMKANFLITIIHPAGTTAISNSPARRIRNISRQWSETEFEKTPKMSTYLLAIAVSDFVFRFRLCKNIEIRIWSQKPKQNDTAYALDIVCQLLLYYEDFFSISYPLKKLDVFAVPELRVLAMENWGLIMVRQKLVVYNAKMNSLRERRVVTDVLAHEVAHMWFGNLVTMRWWNDLWLNEGFATMMAPKAADHVENSTLRTSQYFTADVALKALSGDQHARTTQPISLKKNSDRVHVQDSKILYNKGATVLRMVESTIGADVFRRGLNPYLRKFAYSNADKNDFLASFSLIFNESDHREDAFVSSNFSVSDFIDSWIYQPGFPLLEVRRTRGHFEISQNIFDVDENPAFANLQWKVPIFVGRGEKRSVLWLKENETVILHDKKRPFLIDIDSHGYYRVVYDEETWNDITDLLLRSYEELPVSTRLKLLDDAFVLSEYGRIPYSIPLRMSQYLREEHEVMPFLTFFARYEYIHQRLFRHPNATLMDKYVQFLLEPMFATIVSENRIDAVETVMEKEFMRELVLLKMCVSGYRACIEAVRPKFDELRKSCAYGKLSSACNRVDPSMRSIVYMVASKYGNQSDFLFLREKHREEEYHAERDRLFSAMAFASNRSNIVALVKEVLAIKDRDTDFRPKLFELARKNYDNEIISDYLHYNFNELLKNHKKYASFFILQMSRMYGTGNDVLKLDDFERKYSNLLGRMKGVLRHVREDIKRKIDWTKRYSNEIFRFLASRV